MTKPSVAFSYRRVAVAVAFASSAASISPVISAQEQRLEEISVTGSRIRMTDGMATPVPVTAVTTTELQAFDPGGTVAEQLDALPQFFNTGSAQRGGGVLFGTGGGSYLNMRNLGAQRTLVLFDGSRVVPADKRGSVNVDTLPTALMRSIDVVTGGASAAYGADALGGVSRTSYWIANSKASRSILAPGSLNWVMAIAGTWKLPVVRNLVIA
jgi:iron complex outermembrane recepter protein